MNWILGYSEIEEEVEPLIDFREEFPLHVAVIEKDLDKLTELVGTPDESELPPDEDVDIYEKPINKRDCKGYSPLTLCILTGFSEGAKLLLDRGAFTKVRHPDRHFHSGHACILAHDREVLKKLLRCDMKYTAEKLKRSGPLLRQKLNESRDFYMDINWNFHSSIPFTGKYCPSDTWQIWKKNDHARLDFTLIDFDQTAMRWVRGNMSIIVVPNEETGIVEVNLVDHAKKLVTKTDRQKEMEPKELDIDFQTEMFLQTEVVLPKFDIEEVEFSPVTGYLGGEYRGEHNGFQTQDYKLSNIQTQFAYCDGHIPEEWKSPEFKEERGRRMQDQMQFIDELPTEEEKDEAMMELTDSIKADFDRPELVQPTVEEYFETDMDIVPHQMMSYSKNLSLNVTVADDYPLNLKEDVLPILQCLARAENPMLNKLKQVLDVDFPEGGFPVKIELPLYKVFKATVTFERCESGSIDDSIFTIPEYPLKNGDTRI